MTIHMNPSYFDVNRRATKTCPPISISQMTAGSSHSVTMTWDLVPWPFFTAISTRIGWCFFFVARKTVVYLHHLENQGLPDLELKDVLLCFMISCIPIHIPQPQGWLSPVQVASSGLPRIVGWTMTHFIKKTRDSHKKWGIEVTNMMVFHGRIMGMNSDRS